MADLLLLPRTRRNHGKSIPPKPWMRKRRCPTIGQKNRLDKTGFLLYLDIQQQKSTDTMTGKKSLRDASESCRPLRGSAERRDVTGPRVFPLRRRRLGGNGFPHRYQRGGIRPVERLDRCRERAFFMPMRVVPRKHSFRLFKGRGEGFCCCLTRCF